MNINNGKKVFTSMCKFKLPLKNLIVTSKSISRLTWQRVNGIPLSKSHDKGPVVLKDLIIS